MKADIIEVVTTSPFQCVVCGKVDADVRSCCYRERAERTCRACHVAGKGDHRYHVGT